MITETRHIRCSQTSRWRRFDNTPYAIFRSLNRQVSIGVLSFSMLSLSSVENVTAQENLKENKLQEYSLEEVEVSASRSPLSELEAARPVIVLSRKDISSRAIHSINDLLKYVVGVDVRQRSGFGVQTDISVRGGTFDQITILLNGVNINVASTGHLSADFPIAISDIERIEIIEGSASRVFGTQSLTGAINIVTKVNAHSGADIRLMGGQYGLANVGASVNFTGKKLKQQISSNLGRSDGAVDNSDYLQRKGYYQGQLQTKPAKINWQAGVSSKDFGANTFYTAAFSNQYEETRRYISSLKVKSKGKVFQIEPMVYWNRTYDHYVLVRNNPEFYQNYHKMDTYGYSFNTYLNSSLGRTSIGAEVRGETVWSTSLGKPVDEEDQKSVHENGLKYTNHDKRKNYSVFAEHNIVLKKWTFSMGLMANRNTCLDSNWELYPGMDVSFRPAKKMKLFASWNKGMRLPTFTDLYYKSPTTSGNENLKAENTRSWSIGTSYLRKMWNMNVEGFYISGTDMIDWVMYSADDVYHSANFKLDNMGFEVNSTFKLSSAFPQQRVFKNIHAGYNYICQKRYDEIEIYKSNYAMQYLRHKFESDINLQFSPKITGKVSYIYKDRMGSYIEYNDLHKSTGELVDYKPYSVVDAKLTYHINALQLYIEANNIFNEETIDLGNIPQSGRWVCGGLIYHINWNAI